MYMYMHLTYVHVSLQAYLHQMIRRSKAYVLQPLASTLFLIISLLGASIELGVKRSHWYDILAGFALGSLMAIYQVNLSIVLVRTLIYLQSCRK